MDSLRLFAKSSAKSVRSFLHIHDEVNGNHYDDIEVLDLFDWEVKSLEGVVRPNATQREVAGTCTPPPGVPTTCCIGSFSTGGAVTAANRGKCAKSLIEDGGLEALRQSTLQFFKDNALRENNAMACDVCRIVEIARRDNLTVALMGDSMHNQVHDGLLCELQRRGYNVTTEYIDYNPKNEVTWIYRRFTLSILLHIQSPSWGEQESITIAFHRMYLLPLVSDDVAMLTANIDVLVLGFGLHWWYDENQPHVFRTPKYYVSAMRDLFRNVTEQGTVKLLAHRETSAQHFDADGGEFSLWYPNREHLSQECKPMLYDGESVAWREKAIQRAANQSGHTLVMAGPNMPPHQHNTNQGVQEVVVLPYFNFTAKHHGMHPLQGEDTHDCTHYCSSPYVYYPIWRSLRFAMERQFAQ
ncbi:expressed unknown protein [Seminavis robusta]|uniref:Uncharacterized protein n=1 Tax=Seminavis robusta TaxID=568900 RepID=A0A9N8EDM8_9STRA|nr:expressed unknown protein [Seminavis robusta]|eukprot:Sro969_g226260.1 n/a (412) ;mRNA; f:30892-32127